MKVYKIYGDYIYVNSEKTNVFENKLNLVLEFKKIAYGYHCDDLAFLIESELDEMLLRSMRNSISFTEVEVPYSTFKTLQNMPGAGYLKKKDYNPEKKTIVISYNPIEINK